MNYNDSNNFKIPETPNLAQGKFNPILEYELKCAKEEYERKRQFRHDWVLALFSAVSGAVFGFLTSFIFWIIEK